MRDPGKNDASRNRAEHHAEPWTEYDDEVLQDMWTARHTEEELAEIAEALGRTIEACRQRYYVVRRAERVQYHSRTTTTGRGREEQVTSEVTRRRRPDWMDDDEEGSPWYV